MLRIIMKIVWALAVLVAGLILLAIVLPSSAPDEPAPAGDPVAAAEERVPWENYSPTVKERLYNLYDAGNCLDLQSQFDISYDNDTAQRNRVGVGNSELMDLTDSMMRAVGCYN